jgi:CRISPR-associated protein Csb3
MAIASIPVDLFNPGQVFACIGFAEAATILLGDTEAAFDWRDPGETTFHLGAPGDGNPIEAILTFLENAEVHVIAPAGSKNSTENWNIPVRLLKEGEAFPFPDPDSPATLPAVLEGKGPDGNLKQITIDYWGDETRDSAKLWGGARGYSGAALARDCIALVQDTIRGAYSDPFSATAVQSSSFRLDWRRDYIPIDAGFSVNRHTDMSPVGYPLVEIFGAIGLTNARPRRIDTLHYSYAVIGTTLGKESLFDVNFLRLALTGTTLPFPMRRFSMSLGWPAQEGQARCITVVKEEPNDD